MTYDVYPRTRAKVRTVFPVYLFFFSLPSCFWLKISLSRNYKYITDISLPPSGMLGGDRQKSYYTDEGDSSDGLEDPI